MEAVIKENEDRKQNKTVLVNKSIQLFFIFIVLQS